MSTLAEFVAAYQTELRKPDGWDGAYGTTTTIDEYFKDVGERMVKASRSTLISAAEAQALADSYEVQLKKISATNAKFAPQYGSFSVEVRRFLDAERAVEQSLRTVVANLKAAAGIQLSDVARAQQIARWLAVGGTVTAGIIGGLQISVTAATETQDDVNQVTAGFLTGMWAGYGAGVVAGLYFTGPVGWAAIAIASVAAGYLASNAGEAAWDVWVSDDTNRRNRKLLEEIDRMFLASDPLAIQARDQLQLGAEKLGRLNGTWMVGYSELTAQQKAELTAVVIGAGGGRLNANVVSDLRALFDAGWGAQRLDLRDGMISLVSAIARDARSSYEQRRIVLIGDIIDIDVPAQLMRQSAVLHDAVLTSVDTSAQPFVGNVEVAKARIALAAATVSGTNGDDLLIGSASDDTVTGGAGFDYLLGGSGNDTLSGGSEADTLVGSDGIDILTGGPGSDWLLGGNGDDEYYFSNGSGDDRIVDADGVGKLFFVNSPAVQLTGGKKVPGLDNAWISDEINGVRYGFSYADNGTDLIISKGSSPDKITIRDWQPGQLGITLDGAVATLPPPAATLTGDLIKAVNPNDPIQYVFDAQGNYVAGGAQPNAPDLITGTAAGDLIQGLGGDDALLGRAGDDVIEGGTGNDVLQGGLGMDRLIGGTGNDLIYGASNGALTYPTRTDFVAPTQIDPVLLGRGFNWLSESQPPDALGLHRPVLTLTVERDTQAGDAGNLIDGGAGEDHILAGTGADVVHGGADPDELVGMAGGDVLHGEGGNDRVYGDGRTDDPAALSYTAPEQQGNDVIDGGDGDDVLVGEGGDDEIYGGIGADRLSGDSGEDSITPVAVHGRDYLDGGDGADALAGGGRADDLFGGSDDDQLWGDAGAVDVASPRYLDASVQGDDYLDGEDGNDYLQGEGGGDTLFGGIGNDMLVGDDDQSRLPGAAHGDDYLDGEGGADTLAGGGGADTLFGGADADSLYGDAPQSTLAGQFHGADYLDGEDGDDGLQGDGGDDTLFGGQGIDQLRGDAAAAEVPGAYHGSDYLDGGDDGDTILGDGGSDTLIGGSGADYIDGDADIAEVAGTFHGDDYVDGGAGNDTLFGGGGNDNLIGGDGDDWLAGEDEHAVDAVSTLAGDDLLDGGAGNDTLVGGNGSDILMGGEGTNTLYGGAGDDTYVISGADSFSRITETGGADRLSFAVDTAAANVAPFQYWPSGTVGWGDNYLVINLAGSGHVQVKDGFKQAIESYELADGRVLTFAQLLANTTAPLYLSGGTQADQLSGGGGDDTLGGGGGDDTLDGGAGNDLLSGGLGSDTFIFGRGAGADRLIDYDDGVGRNDVLQIAAGVAPSEMTVRRNGTDLVLSIAGTSDSFTVQSYFDPGTTAHRIDQIKFADGTTWTQATIDAMFMTGTEGDDVLFGTSGDDVIRGFGGNDTLDGDGGNDVLIGGTGQDVLRDVATASNETYRFDAGDGSDAIHDFGGVDRIEFGSGIAPASVSVRHSGLNMTLQYGPGDIVTVNNFFQYTASSEYAINPSQSIESVTFGDGSVWDAGRLLAEATRGTPGDDVLRGYVGPDLMTGGSGDDDLYGDGGDDMLNGDAGNDRLWGGSGSDTLDGGVGNDGLSGEKDNDVYLFGKGDGQDWIPAGSDGTTGDLNVLRFKSGVAPSEVSMRRSGLNLAISIAGVPDQMTVSYFFQNEDPNNAANEVQRIEFADGTAWDLAQIVSRVQYTIDGTTGDDVLVGTAANEIIDGKAGNDRLNGATGNNVYLFGRGDGQDVVAASADSTPGKLNTIRFKAGVAPTDVVATRGFWVEVVSPGYTISHESLILSIAGTTDTITVSDFFKDNDPANPNNGVQRIEFDDGTAWDMARILSEAFKGTDQQDTINGTIWADVISGGNAHDVLYGKEGDDTLNGGNDDDWVFGDAGSDTVLGGPGPDSLGGGTGDDVLDGGTGDDWAQGGTGNDVFLFGQGDGLDVIESEPNATTAETNVLRFRPGVLPTDVQVGRTTDPGDGSNTALRLNILGTADTVTVQGFFLNNDPYNVFNPLTRVEFNNGTIWDVARLVTESQRPWQIVGTSGPDTLTGTAGSDFVRGLAGDDLLDGGAGADTLEGGPGNDTYVVDDAGDIVTELAGEGIDLVKSSVNRTLSANVENLTLTGTSGLSGTGNALANVLTGNSGANTLTGGDGDDTLDGGAGNDAMSGGLGNDLYVVNTTSDTVTENANEGTDTIQASVSLSTLANNVENLTLTGSSTLSGTGNSLDNVLTGNSAANTLTGNAGNDTLDGGAGNDTMRGGLGDDIYVVNTTSDIVTENAGEGTDTVQTSVTLTLASNAEVLTLLGTSAINGTGNTLANYLRGNSAVNTLNGSSGNDVLQGLAGNDTLTDTSGKNALDGGDGTDTLTGGTSSDFVAGGAGNDTLTLGGGADVVAFNRGHGADAINAPTSGAGLSETNDSLSLGGVRYADLRLARAGNDLYVKVAGTTDSVRFINWYSASGNRTTTTLQMVVDSTADYNAGSTDQLLNKRVVRLNFTTLVNAFNTVYSGNPNIGDWAIPTATLTSAYVAGSDTQAIGADLAYRYGRDGNLSALDYANAVSVLGNASFATAVQTFGANPTTGGVRLLGLGSANTATAQGASSPVTDAAAQTATDASADASLTTEPTRGEIQTYVEQWTAAITEVPQAPSYLVWDALAAKTSALAATPMAPQPDGTLGDRAAWIAPATDQSDDDVSSRSVNSIPQRWRAVESALARLDQAPLSILGGETFDARVSFGDLTDVDRITLATLARPRQPVARASL